MDIIEMLNVAMNLEEDEIDRERASGQFVLQKVPEKLSKADLLFNEIFDEYFLLLNADKEGLKKLITIKMAWYLLGFGTKMATYALRLSNQRYFTNGLFAIGMTFALLDTREILIVLALYCDVQKKNELSFDEMLKQNNDFASLLIAFLKRDEKDKSLECMGYVLKVDENNNETYYRTW